MIKACIFDLDGTLLNTLNTIRARLCEALDKYGDKRIDIEKTRQFVGDGARELIRRALLDDKDFSFDEELLSEITATYVRGYDEKPYDLTEPYGGITEALMELRERGIKLAVLSNKPDSSVTALCEKFFKGSFDLIMGAREGIPLKPSPEGAFYILRELGVLPEEVAYFGDTAVDIKTGLSFGAGVCAGVLWGFRDKDELLSGGAEILLDKPSQILSVV